MNLLLNSIKSEDIISSLISMIAYNISQITYLCCKLHKVKKVYFVGNFVHAQEYTMDRLTNAFDFWARQEMKLIYMTHDGYLGAFGALLNQRKLNEKENK